MKKRVLIIIQSFNIGGTLSSLCSLLSVLDTEKVSVDVFSRDHTGPYINHLPNCRLLKEDIWLSYRIRNGSFLSKLAVRLLWITRKLLECLGVDMYKIYNWIGGKKNHSEDYDVIIGYDESLARIVSCFPAKRRINWIHCDYRRFAKGHDESKYYEKIDGIVCVSEFAKSIFCEIYPKYQLKVFAIHNIIDNNAILRLSKIPIDDYRFDSSCFTIVSCGRLDPVKQFNKIPAVVAKLKQMDAPMFKWYIIGGGSEKDLIETEIEKTNTFDRIVLLGMKENIYPYLAKSDLYACTSYSESYPMAIHEAKALFKPVISTDFPSVRESLREGIDGWICKIEDFPCFIYKQMESPLKININSYVNENEQILNQFYKLL